MSVGIVSGSRSEAAHVRAQHPISAQKISLCPTAAACASAVFQHGADTGPHLSTLKVRGWKAGLLPLLAVGHDQGQLRAHPRERFYVHTSPTVASKHAPSDGVDTADDVSLTGG